MAVDSSSFTRSLDGKHSPNVFHPPVDVTKAGTGSSGARSRLKINLLSTALDSNDKRCCFCRIGGRCLHLHGWPFDREKTRQVFPSDRLVFNCLLLAARDGQGFHRNDFHAFTLVSGLKAHPSTTIERGACCEWWESSLSVCGGAHFLRQLAARIQVKVSWRGLIEMKNISDSNGSCPAAICNTRTSVPVALSWLYIYFTKRGR